VQSLRRSTERDRSAELGDLGRVRYHASEKARLDRPERVLQVPDSDTFGVVRRPTLGAINVPVLARE
jgi:hypothetical protein